MTGEELINAVISFYDQTDPTDAGNANRRLRVLHYAQMVMDEVWNYRDWSFKYKQGGSTSALGSVGLPTDFQRLGPNGLVWTANPRAIWIEAPAQDVIALQTRGDSTKRVFAITGNTGGDEQIMMIPNTVDAISLSLYYEAAPPTLADDSGTTPLGIPISYHSTVLLAGTIARTQTSKNDTRIYWEGKFAQGLARMAANDLENQTRLKQMPMTVGRGMW